MLLHPEYLSQKLDRPLQIKGGAALHTIGQAVDYMTGIGKKRGLLNHWLQAGETVIQFDRFASAFCG
jgi:hypothetical protein